MCLFSVYKEEDGNLELLCERVCQLEDLGEKIRCIDLFGKDTYVPGRICLIDTNKARIEITPLDDDKVKACGSVSKGCRSH